MVLVNELARTALKGALVASGVAFEAALRVRIAGYARAQARLARRYHVTAETPIRAWGPEVEAGIARFADGRDDVRWAYTSGSTAVPKKVAFTPARLARIKRGSFSVGARLLLQDPACRTGLFILSSLKSDDSLTSLLLDGEAPPWPLGLILPARFLRDPEVAPLIARYGQAAVRLWLMVLADPGIVYSTNPSTLAVFLAELTGRWDETTRLARDVAAGVDPAPRVTRGLTSPGARERMAAIAAARAPLPLWEMLPGLRVYSCWDGGYVRPFLEQLERHLPRDRYRFVPMYSMSTETVETLTFFDGDVVRFLPIAPGVLYEFLPEGAPDEPAYLQPAAALEPGRAYTMVVSDPYGLVRYQTEDLFHCRARVGDVPDLVFLRRRGLEYSFTGEKLTDRQLEQAFGALRDALPALREAGVQLTCIPSEAGALPGYRLVLAHPGAAPALDAGAVAARFDGLIAAINCELQAKLETGRLAPTRATVMPYAELAARLGHGWDSQFKLLPLYRRTWESYGLDRD